MNMQQLLIRRYYSKLQVSSATPARQGVKYQLPKSTLSFSDKETTNHLMRRWRIFNGVEFGNKLHFLINAASAKYPMVMLSSNKFEKNNRFVDRVLLLRLRMYGDVSSLFF